MDIESKIWTWTNVGTKKHAFVDGVALCRKNITRNPESVALHGMDYFTAKGASICIGCDRKFNAAIEREEAYQARLAASMQPSTGEGDHLPPAETPNTDTKEDTMALKDGPITPRQARIIELASAGMRQNEIARKLGVSYPVIRMEVTAIVQKFKADSSGQVYALHARAEAYLSAAELLEGSISKYATSSSNAATDVDRVISGLAKILRERAAALLPK